MTTITFNPENWVDDSASYMREGNVIEVKGERLTLEPRAPLFNQDTNGKVTSETEWDFYAYEVQFDGRYFCTIAKFGQDNVWECCSGDIHRDHADPFTLAAIMASNLI